MNAAHRTIASIAVLILFASQLSAQSADPLAEGFANPPNVARPRVWWHWMNGNISEPGIDLDLEWMQRIGLGGFHTFDAALNTPTIVDHRLIYMTPEWKRAFNHAVLKANDLGLEVTIASSPGWSETGGPWVTPEQGMKKLVWSETDISAGSSENPSPIKLPAPPSNAGPFQSLKVDGPSFYRNVAVFAYPINSMEPAAIVTLSSNTDAGIVELIPADHSLLTGNTSASTITLKPTPDHDAWVKFSYASAQTITGLAFNFSNTPKLGSTSPAITTQLTLERSDDGITFNHAVDLPQPTLIQRTATFAPITARFFRFRIHSPAGNHPAFAKGYDLTTLQLFTQPRNPDFELKAGFLITPDYYALPSATGPATPTSAIIDLTTKMSADGTLTWIPPAGNWRILRLGYSLIGKTNHPAPPEATGLEVDQLSAKHVESYMDHYLSTYTNTVGPDQLGASGIRFLLTDSTETGPENWTDDMEQQFKTLRGYDLRPWLPALTGIIVQSPDATDRFLWDYRRTIAQLTASSHYDTISRILHQHHLGYYGEALESGRPELGDDLEMRRATDIPMGAMWVDAHDQPVPKYDADLRGAASIAHIYGQNLVGAESLTARYNPWGYAPADLKPAADMEMLDGVNRFMIHEMTHQPVTGKLPGLSLGVYGQWFGRNETWAEQARPWIDYLARCSFMLQQGRFNADLAYFYGEEAPLDLQYANEKGLPENNGYDFINSDILQHKLSVDSFGNLVTPSGATYQLIFLGGSSTQMTVPTLRRLLDLVKQGATIAGHRPVDTPSQADNPAEFQQLTTELWGTRASTGTRKVGLGHVLTAATASEALDALAIPSDWTYTTTSPDTRLGVVHRKLPNGEIYFVVNRSAQPLSTELSLVANGLQPELWSPDTGAHRHVSYTVANSHMIMPNFINNRITIPLTLDPNGSLFIVFRTPATTNTVTISEPTLKPLQTLAGPWQLTFEPNRGASATATFNTLTSWSTNPDPGIRFFSGHATYTKTLTLTPDQLARPIYLDLGDVKNLAEITINNKFASELWKPPFRLDITPYVHSGDNKLEVRVVNLWPNRIIGDLQPNTTKTYTFTAFKPFKPDSPLLPSGLLGPVQLLTEDQTH